MSLLIAFWGLNWEQCVVFLAPKVVIVGSLFVLDLLPYLQLLRAFSVAYFYEIITIPFIGNGIRHCESVNTFFHFLSKETEWNLILIMISLTIILLLFSSSSFLET